MSGWNRHARKRPEEKPAVSKLRRKPLTNKPHIYLHCYPSGLKFWRAAKPIRYKNTRCLPLLLIRAAHDFVNTLNNRRTQPCNSTNP